MRIGSVLRSFTLLLLPLLVTAETTSQVGGNEACGQSPRIRKSWSSLSSSEKNLFLEAMDTAIKNGAIKEFAAIHVEPNGESQAHRSCGFFSWHRRLLIAMESYLRDQDPKFACVTIPYYDVQTAYVRQAAGECANLYECSDILQEIGGNKAGNDKVSLTQNGKTATGYPVTGYPFTDDCDDKNVCGYTVRSDMTTKPVPSAAGFASFLSIVHSSATYATFLMGIQFGVHNEIHNAVGGTMATFASPRDIFFYSWHAAIDMYLYVYHLCNFGQHLTEEQLLSSKAFTNATDSCDGISGIGPNAKIVQNVIVNGETMDVADHPTLGKYFSHAGSEMWNYGDVTQLGDYSYVYDLPDIVTQQLLSNNEICAAFNTPTSAPSTAPPTSSPETETPLTPGTISPSGSSDSSWSGINGSDVGSSNSDDVYIDSPDDVGYGYFNDTEVPSHSGIYVVDNSTDGSTDAQPSNANSGDYWQWAQTTYEGLYDRFDGKIDLVVQQMLYTECEAFNKVHGIEDFSDDFVQNFHLASARPICGKKVDEVESGDVVVACKTDEFTPDTVEFADDDVIQEIKADYVPTTITEQFMDSDYFVDAQKKAHQTPVGGSASSPVNQDGATSTSAPTTSDYNRKHC
ncbi:Mucin [Phytophthora megakarya]|uniref:Mucin n=1 Tax=Phytophthora megakarya TaxID=4795 RepID=A0A225W8Z8_9STRA|nr:Mucin [Phytophthora megakarya]